MFPISRIIKKWPAHKLIGPHSVIIAITMLTQLKHVPDHQIAVGRCKPIKENENLPTCTYFFIKFVWFRTNKRMSLQNILCVWMEHYKKVKITHIVFFKQHIYYT